MTPRVGRRSLLGLAAGASAVLAGCSDPVPPPPGTRTLTYGDADPQFAELSRPEGPSRGVVVVLHGGFWLAQYGVELGRPLATDLVARGWTVLDVEYRRVGNGGGVPETLDDVSAALDLLAGADVDTGTVVALGHSAGGQLAAWAAGRTRLTRWARATVAVTHVVSQAGVLDLRAAADADLGGGAVRGFLGGGPDEVPGAYALADPAAQVPLEVPVWCVHGEIDDTVPVAQSRSYVDAARAAGGTAELVLVPGGHLRQIDTGSQAWARTRGILDGIAPLPAS
ncbi:alpha/beta hydrolase family protein [Phycicoccus flavus]|uniref:alpha/beta hydrolase family protein n=1 Tax=Phycicoccus flavus TaxID=2502783 RepID=UPI000FEB6B8A|nr:alpha/beta hydrolase [Phycicoccus flavus]NHA69618.1 alpha/beta hydrolase [Phycicoccus flavus]